MKQLVSRLESGERFFGSGGHNSERFEEFFEDFKRAFTYQLKKLKANTISFSKGHYYISGFFKIEDQFYYFSLSDVRDGVRTFDKPKMLIRTAKSAEDYTGGGNNYVAIEEGMYKGIARTFRIALPERKPATKKSSVEVAQDIIKKGFADMYVGSMKRANEIAWAVDKILSGRKDGLGMRIQRYAYGRTISKAEASTDELNYYYDAYSKRIQIQIYDRKFDAKAFLKTLQLPKNPEYRVNPFTKEGETLEPLAVALHDYIKEAELKQSPLFQEALLLFREKYPDAYMTLLD